MTQSTLYTGISDQALANERRAQEIYFAAELRFKTEVLRAKSLSNLVSPDLQYVLDALSDNAPTQAYWDDKIHEARK